MASVAEDGSSSDDPQGMEAGAMAAIAARKKQVAAEAEAADVTPPAVLTHVSRVKPQRSSRHKKSGTSGGNTFKAAVTVLASVDVPAAQVSLVSVTAAEPSGTPMLAPSGGTATLQTPAPCDVAPASTAAPSMTLSFSTSPTAVALSNRPGMHARVASITRSNVLDSHPAFAALKAVTADAGHIHGGSSASDAAKQGYGSNELRPSSFVSSATAQSSAPASSPPNSVALARAALFGSVSSRAVALSPAAAAVDSEDEEPPGPPPGVQ